MSFEFYHNALPQELQNTTLQFLKTQVPWRTVTYYSSKRKQNVTTPRSTWVCGFHDSHLYDIGNIQPEPFPKPIQPLIKWVQAFTNAEYNFLLFAKYSKGTDSITWHSDDEKFIKKNSPITSLTFLEPDSDPRTFYLKNKITKQKHSWELSTGDLLKMHYECQQKYQHAILKEPNKKGTRYSITFRNAANQSGTKNYYTYN